MKNSLLGSCCIGVIFIFGGVVVAFSQNSRTPLDRGFIDKTIAYYYGKQIKLHPANTLFLIEKDSFKLNARTDYAGFKVQFVSKEDLAGRITKSRKKTSLIDRMVIKWISLDTIDVAIARCTLEAKNVTKIINGKNIPTVVTLMSNCVGANVGIPVCRFIYNQPTSSWAQLDEGQLVRKN